MKHVEDILVHICGQVASIGRLARSLKIKVGDPPLHFQVLLQLMQRLRFHLVERLPVLKMDHVMEMLALLQAVLKRLRCKDTYEKMERIYAGIIEVNSLYMTWRMKMPKNIKTNRETKTGGAIDYKVGKGIVSRKKLVEQVEQGKFPDHHVIHVDGVPYVRSNPDSSTGNNVDK